MEALALKVRPPELVPIGLMPTKVARLKAGPSGLLPLWAWLGLCVFWVSAGDIAFAAPQAPETPAPRNYLQRSYTKMRPGSMLRGDNGVPLPVQPDLRSAAGKRRDQDVMKHFARLAELDVVDTFAERRKDVSLQETVEDVRRKEMERFHTLMQELRGISWRTWLGELP